MALQTQVYVYSIDTSAFYTKKEQKIHRILNKRYIINSKLKKSKQNKRYKEYIQFNNKKIKDNKEILLNLLKKNKNIRELNTKFLIKKHIVSMFESTLSRTIQIPVNTISTDIFIVKAYFFEVLKDIILDGFMFNNEKYICFTASAGQIRTKKTMFIKESVFQNIQSSLMCGLTIEDINNCGGVNINKYLTYLALCNSATDQWIYFDIKKSIVIDDMEFNITGIVDFIDDKTYEITRKEESIPITNTDGCGMILPQKSKKSFMVRLPWIKGLLVPFSFDKFVSEISHNSKVKDIYGKEWDIIQDGIEIIFTKSQFKMWKFYRSWQEYCNNFIKYNCHAAICNLEEDVFTKATFNYQMMQSLVDITDTELKYLINDTKDDIYNLGRDKKTMLKVFSITNNNINKTYLQQAIELYPSLLSDVYTKEVLRDIKKSMVKESRAAKFKIEGKYTFICPDLYAFCEYIFNNNKMPKGLLNNGEVYCNLYYNINKLDCLRSPSLYKEHAVRNNVVDEEKKKWFITNGLYTSSQDLISKILQFDNDGDRSLVVADTTLVSIAERNMKNVVPLYYIMKKSEAELITNKSIYKSLCLAYKGGNIGIYSNNITKIWNSDNITQESLDVIKLLCMENNYTIDFAKTLYKPNRPENIKKIITKYTKGKLPHFFIYAKDKNKNQVKSYGCSPVDRLNEKIPNPRIHFSEFGNFNYIKLMFNPYIKKDLDIINVYNNNYKRLKYQISFDERKDNNIAFIRQDIIMELFKINPDPYYITDVLIKYLYEEKNSKYKDTLWICFGDIIINNIKRNVNEVYIYCERCGILTEQKKHNHKYCFECAKKIKNEQNKKYYILGKQDSLRNNCI